MTFSEKLLKLRKEQGLSQEELAERLAVTRQAISRWENGETMPDAPNLLKLSDLFDVSIDALLREGECPGKISAAEPEEKAADLPQEERCEEARPARKVPHLLCGFLWIISAGCMVTAGAISGGIYYVAIAFVDVLISCVHFFLYFRRSSAWKNCSWHTMKKESRQYLFAAVSFLFAAYCFFFAGAIGGNLLSAFAGIMELVASLGFFHRWHKSMMDT